MSVARSDGWLSLPISDIAVFGSGDLISVAKLSSRSESNPIPVYGGNGIAGYTALAMVDQPTVILGRVGQKCGVVYQNEGPAWITDNALYARQFRRPLDVRFLAHALEAAGLNDVKNRNDLPLITQSILNDVEVPWPKSLQEQHAIASTLSTVDELIAQLRRLVAKRQHVHEGLSQTLLTGTSRLRGYEQPWQTYPMADLLAPRTERNVAGEHLEVLSCTKHRGFVRSLDYFNTQVFSRNLANYLVIHRGDIGYPANHVEEGSIGVQEIVDRGLVSPIYVVMHPREGVDTYFVQRRLKLNSFRHELARSTNASVNRRGSLRWKEFSRLSVLTPSDDEEQRAVSRVLRDSEAAVAALQAKLVKIQHVKQGMMQQLLTGRIRLPMGVAA